MSSSWRECKLGDLGSVITGKTPSSKNPEDWGFEIPFVTPSDYKNYGKFALSSDRNLSNDGISRLQNKILPENSIMVTCIGSDMGKIAMNKIPVITNQQINSIIPDQKIVDSNFLYYRLVSLYETLRIYGSDGTAVPIINKTDFENIETEIPPLEKQKMIAEVLSSLDDKIDLLHRQNQTLEDLAQTLFRQWFIEEAKEEWEDKPLGEIALHVKNNIKTSSFKNKSFFHFSLPAFDNGQRPIKELGNEILSNKYQVVKNSILVSKLNPRTPRIWLIDGNIDEDNSICSTEFQVLYPKEEIWRGFIYCYLKTEQAIQKLAGASGGTSGSHQRVKPEDIFNLIFQYPDIETLKKFDDRSSDYWKKIKVNQKQIQILEDLRDTLLPKLLSGEVRIDDMRESR